MMGTATAAYQVEGAWNESGMPQVIKQLFTADSSVTILSPKSIVKIRYMLTRLECFHRQITI